MKFSVDSQLLKREIEAIEGVVPSNPTLPILENFLLLGEAGALHIVASDSHTEIRTTVAVTLEEEGSMAVPAKIFRETIKKLPEQPLSLYSGKSSYDTHIDCKTGNYKISSVNPEDFPESARPKEGSLSLDIPALSFLEAIESTLYATSKDELRPAMMGLFVRVQARRLVFVATDGHRLVEYAMSHEKECEPQDIIIPRRTMEQLERVIPKGGEGAVRFIFDENHVIFETENKRIVSKLIDDKFPPYENVIPSIEENKNVLEIDRARFLNALDRSGIYANKATFQVRLSFRSPDSLTLTAEDLDYANKLEEQLGCLYEGEPLEIGFNVRFLTDTLKHMGSDRVRVHLNTPKTGAILKNPEDTEAAQSTHLIMPIMLE